MTRLFSILPVLLAMPLLAAPPAAALKTAGVQAPLFPEMDLGTAAAFAPRGPPAGVATSAWIKVSAQGLYRVTRADLLGAGFAAQDLAGATLRVFNRGVEVATRASTDGLFGPADQLVFYAEGYAGLATDDNIYWIATGGES
ncbi:MAG: hypothetical protein U1F87_19090, partial [Kiritimatiellia bacterium]